jgi:NADP-dependent 3-hydroxy acid dehydrogenase YdfG
MAPAKPKPAATAGARRPVVWVVGASSGIGSEIARSFAAIGATVCVSGRRRTLLERLRREIESAGGRALSVPFDVTDPAGTAAAWKAVRKKAGPVEVLVNAAGVTVFKDFLDTTIAEFDSIVATNLLGPAYCLKAVLPEMVRRRRGWVFNILSNAAVRTFEGSGAYTASKAGMLGFGRVLREELRPHRVRVVSILPGATDTPMWSPAARKKYRSRMMSARGVAEAVVAAYLMPSDVVVDEMIVRPIGGDIG